MSQAVSKFIEGLFYFIAIAVIVVGVVIGGAILAIFLIVLIALGAAFGLAVSPLFLLAVLFRGWPNPTEGKPSEETVEV